MALRLPRTRYIGVQPLGRRSVGGALAVGRAFGSAFKKVGQAAAGEIERKRVEEERLRKRGEERAKHEGVLASADVSRADAEFAEKYAGRDYVSTDEIPTGIPGINYDQERISFSQVRAAMWRDHMKAQVKEKAKQIGDSTVRAAWTARQMETINKGFITKQTQDIDAEEALETKEIEAQVKLARREGDYALAAGIVAASSLPDHRKVVLLGEIVGEEEYSIITKGMLAARTTADLDDLEDRLLEPRNPLTETQQAALGGQIERRRNRMTRDRDAKIMRERKASSSDRANAAVVDMYVRDKPMPWAEVGAAVKGMEPGDAARVIRLNLAMHKAPTASDRETLATLSITVRRLSTSSEGDTDRGRESRARHAIQAIDDALYAGRLTADDHRKLQEDVGRSREAPLRMNPDINRVEGRIYRLITGAGRESGALADRGDVIMLNMALEDYYDAMRRPNASPDVWWQENRHRYMPEAASESETVAMKQLTKNLGVVTTDPEEAWAEIQKPAVWLTLPRTQKVRLRRWYAKQLMAREERGAAGTR